MAHSAHIACHSVSPPSTSDVAACCTHDDTLRGIVPWQKQASDDFSLVTVKKMLIWFSSGRFRPALSRENCAYGDRPGPGPSRQVART